MRKIEFKVNPCRNEFLYQPKCVYCGKDLYVEHESFFNEIGDSANFYCRPCDKETNILIQDISFKYSIVPKNLDDMKEFFRQRKEAIEKIKKEIHDL